MTKPIIETFFHQPSWTFSYVVWDEATRAAAVVDPVLDYEHRAGRTSTESADAIISYIKEHGLELVWILETHAHADHITGARHLQQQLGGKIAIGQGITKVQDTFKKVFNIADPDLIPDGSHFDHLFTDGESFRIGNLNAKVMATPGHTNDSITYLVEEKHAFVGDSIFMPDMGTARCDFPGGDARLLHSSIQKLFSLGDDVTLYMCHDYQPGGRELKNITTVAEQRANNIHVRDSVPVEEFVTMRTERDATLALPELIFPSVQLNIRAGDAPKAEDNGMSYIKIPMNLSI